MPVDRASLLDPYAIHQSVATQGETIDTVFTSFMVILYLCQ